MTNNKIIFLFHTKPSFLFSFHKLDIEEEGYGKRKIERTERSNLEGKKQDECEEVEKRVLSSIYSKGSRQKNLI